MMTLRRLLLAALPAALAASCSQGAAEPPPATPQTPPDAAPVLVELFTSQGCSSCPPADQVLSDLGRDPAIIPLAFHVDYWDYIGWKDPFASPAWSNRQRAYAQAMGTSRIYTPQLVVSGREHLVGSNKKGVQQAIQQARATPTIATLQVQQRPDPQDPQRIAVTVTVTPRQGVAKEAHELFVALVEDGAATQVTRGENTGRTLRNDHIVRALTKSCTLLPNDASPRTCEATLAVDPAWKPEHLRAVAFAQHPGTRHVAAAGRAAR